MRKPWFHFTALCLALLAAGCGDPEGSAEGPTEWIEAVRASDAEASVARAEGRMEDAESSLRRALEREVPEGVVASDVAAVHRGLLGQLAELALERGDYAAVERWVGRGLALSDQGDVLRSNLLILRGDARRLSGDARAAAADYHAAVTITDALLQESLRDDVHVPLPERGEP